MTTKEIAKVTQGWMDGKTIQVKDGDKWYDLTEEPNWHFDHRDYRVKPSEPKLRPYANAAEFLQAMKEHGPYLKYKPNHDDSEMYYYIPTYISNDAIGVCTNINDGVRYYPFDELLGGYDVWQDGTPCGIIEEE